MRRTICVGRFTLADGTVFTFRGPTPIHCLRRAMRRPVTGCCRLLDVTFDELPVR